MTSASISRDCIECDATGCSMSGPSKCCARCRTTYYCGSVCQKAHWREHKPNCRSVQSVRDNMIDLGTVDVPDTENAVYADAQTREINSCCYICLDEPPVDPYRVPSCGHIFCFNCLRQWQSHVMMDPALSTNRSCPACRGANVPDLEKSATENAILFATRACNGSDLSEVEKEEYRQKALAELERVDSSYTPETRIQTLVTKGEVLSHLGRYHEAIKTCEEIIQLNEEGIEAQAQGEALTHQLNEAIEAGRDDDADAISELMKPLLEKLLFANQGKLIIATHLTIAENMESIEDWEGALNVYLSKVMAVAEFDSNELPVNHTAVDQRRMYMGMSRCFYHLGDYEKSIRLGEVAIQMNRHFPQVHTYVALSQKASGDTKAALLTMARAVYYETPWDDVNEKKNLETYETMKNEAEI